MNKVFMFIILLLASRAFTQQLTAEQVKADMDTVLSVLSEIHPTFNASSHKQKLVKLRKQQIDSMSVHDFFHMMQPLVTLDGHTTFQFTAKIYPEIDNPLLPFETVVYKKKLYVKTNLSTDNSIQKGSEILTINNKKSSHIIREMLEYLPGERKANKIRKLDNAGFPNLYRLVYGNFKEFQVTYRNNGGIKKTVVEGKHWKDFPSHESPHLELNLLDDQTALLRIGKFLHPRTFIPFLDSAFAEINQRKISNLIIDKTHGGGFTTLADSLMSYLTDQPFRQFEKMRIRTSRESAEYIAELAGEGRNEGDYFLVENDFTQSRNRDNRFVGNLYILTGPTAYSAATLFVAMAKKYSNAIIVGEETGQPLISNGALSRHTLPNSGIKLYTSHSIYYFPGYKNNRDSVKPHHHVKKSLDDLLNEKDPYLKFVLHLIASE